MGKRRREPYVFVGTEREVVDPERFQRAMRAWATYLTRRMAEERVSAKRLVDG